MTKNLTPLFFRTASVIVTLSTGVILLLFSIYLLLFHSIILNPDDENLNFITFSDSKDIGIECSKVENFKKTNDMAQLSYIIGDKIDFPYIGFAIRPKDKRKWNCNLFDQIKICVDAKQTNNFTLLLWTYIEGFSSIDQNMSWRIFEKDFTMNESGEFTLPLSQFVTPIWWFGSNNLQENGDRSSLSGMGEIHIQSHPLSPKKQILRIAFKEIKFYHSIKQIYPLFVLSAFFILLSFWLQKKLKVETPFYKPLVINDRNEEDQNRLVEFLAKEYCRQDLTLNKTAIETNIPEKQIRTILKSFHKKSFKEYLTVIRMEESKRLLLESDRNISEISHLIGYKHPTTFTRIFRETYGVSPKIFREQNS